MLQYLRARFFYWYNSICWKHDEPKQPRWNSPDKCAMCTKDKQEKRNKRKDEIRAFRKSYDLN